MHDHSFELTLDMRVRTKLKPVLTARQGASNNRCDLRTGHHTAECSLLTTY